ncbi:splicing factor, proline- and glutamine-rich-like [Dromiciops gliroides]|uniref:splicing factor, proline- and glutamine-rich-like n=1 Tax=Dromiciops gliroides TaxID=33562 RepID=UPI001CC3D2C0|nr:splicing factor, proline- and glutamine-rich-like [Dromiciops gliroides]
MGGEFEWQIQAGLEVEKGRTGSFLRAGLAVNALGSFDGNKEGDVGPGQCRLELTFEGMQLQSSKRRLDPGGTSQHLVRHGGWDSRSSSRPPPGTRPRGVCVQPGDQVFEIPKAPSPHSRERGAGAGGRGLSAPRVSSPPHSPVPDSLRAPRSRRKRWPVPLNVQTAAPSDAEPPIRGSGPGRLQPLLPPPPPQRLGLRARPRLPASLRRPRIPLRPPLAAPAAAAAAAAAPPPSRDGRGARRGALSLPAAPPPPSSGSSLFPSPSPLFPSPSRGAMPQALSWGAAPGARAARRPEVQVQVRVPVPEGPPSAALHGAARPWVPGAGGGGSSWAL